MLTPIEVKNREYLKQTKPLAYEKVMKYDEQLAKGKSIAMLQIHPSYACNFHCNHCLHFHEMKKGMPCHN